MAYTDLYLYAQLSGLRVLVLANRLGCDNDIARGAHDKLATVLAGMIADQRKILDANRAYASARGTSDEQDSFCDLHYCRTAFIEKWLEQPVALLDDHLVDDFTREYFDFRVGRWFFCDDVLPIVVAVDDDTLCGLAEIIAEIEDISGINLTVEHVYYSEAEAEAAWYESTGEAPDVLLGMEEARNA